MSDIEIGFDAGRLCEAIARIGYEPDSAIMDIVDNSVSAKAKNVYITLSLLEGKTIKHRNSVKMYQIVDDGIGMDEKGIQQAFSLGAKRKYEINSLSKYGLGLKSAGLSLGTRISIISKKNNKLTDKYTFDKDLIEKNNKFMINVSKLNNTEKDTYDALIQNDSGTIIEIEGCERVNHASPDLTRNKLKKKLGVVYYSFLKNDKNKLDIYIKVKPYFQEIDFEKVEPKDFLHTDSPIFKEHWSPDNYDFVSPYLAVNEPWILHDVNDKALPAINVQAVVFPQRSMATTKSPLNKKDKAIISNYEISKENSGFFIYRNGRLIRWGDDLGGMISKDDFNIRIRLDIQSEHDDVLHVDVTKQRLEIDDIHWERLKNIVSKSLQTAKEVREQCQRFINQCKEGDEGLSFSYTLEGVAEDDPDEIIGTKPSAEVVERKKISAEESKIIIKEIKEERVAFSDNDEDEILHDEDDIFRKINYSTNVPYGYVWKPYHDAIEGTFVNVNKNHPYYSEFLTRFSENSLERLSLEAIIFSIGLAENNVKHNFDNLDKETLDSIFRKFHKNISNWLSEWSAENYNLKNE
ncbi:ATP-binding protein [Franconibacter sp. IITDAS19]|uniref:ATP-binding protein n=1 Tax=Franconibacter sp. IITDAS19 TaxID=2930569 RepID=UPI001FF82921|nr:ATP-binding protein [Franconibacter sp. IITDAS19]MCK1969293.1 ATP-binding protein [Franconibacter sp. IITDAS19]